MSCYTCEIGTTSLAGKTVCFACDAGSYLRTNTGTNFKECVKCSTGKVSTYGQTACTNCTAGYYSNGANSSCSACEAGHYGDQMLQSTNSSCKVCLPGTYSSAIGVSSASGCNDCSPGKYSTTPASTSVSDCIVCSIGEYQNVSGTTTCRECPIGFGNENTGSTACNGVPPGSYSWNGKVRECEAGHYCTGKAVNQTACLPGFYAPKGSISCIACAPGMYADSFGTIICKDCAKDEYQPGLNATECIEVKEGYYRIGPTTQVPCSAGTSGVGGNATCQKCITGSYQDVAKQTTCDVCPSGWGNNNTGSVSCIPCSPGKFTSTTGNDECKNCPIGYLQPDPQQSDCNGVAAGSIVATGGSAEIAVPDGSRIIPATGEKAASFQACPPGTIGNDPPNETCADCEAGKSSAQGATRCQDCETGKFAPTKASPNCTLCDTSTALYQDNQGKINCKTCESGQMSIGFKCTTFSVDESMPVPSNVLVVPYSVDNDDDHRINVSWTIQDDVNQRGDTSWNEWINQMHSFVIDVSVNPDFPEGINRTKIYIVGAKIVSSSSVGNSKPSGARLLLQQQSMQMKVVLSDELIDWPKEQSIQPLWRSPRYARVQSVGQAESMISAVSGRSGEWTTASSCSDEEWLDDAYASTKCWHCSPCPRGASCFGDIKDTGVQAKFGYSSCETTHMDAATKDSDATTLACTSNRRANSFLFQRCHFAAACLGKGFDFFGFFQRVFWLLQVCFLILI